jgi:polyhydroxyalkanoate synthesis regulator phasin
MKVTISESQFKRMVDNSNRWGLIGISEAGKPKYSPEDIRNIATQYSSRIDFYYDNPYVYRLAKDIMDDLFPESKKMTPEEEDKKIERIINDVKGGKKFVYNVNKNPDYSWILSKGRGDKTGKFQRALDDIKDIMDDLFPESKKMTPEEEDKKIKRIIKHVKKGGDFVRKQRINPDYSWLLDKKRFDKTGKFQRTLDEIEKILEVQGKIREWWGEKTTKEILVKMGFTDIPSLGQYTIDDCKNSLTCRKYKFDVYLPYNETNYNIIKNIPIKPGEPDVPELQPTGIIFEYDGIQHFKSVEGWGGDESFINQIRKDLEKNSYCKDKIKLVRIPYTSNTMDEIKRDIISALKNPDTFVLTGNYPKAGWNK